MQSTCMASIGEPVRRTEIGIRVGKLKNGKAARKDKFTGKMIKD